VVRVSRVPLVEAGEFTLKRWTEFPIYEVCTNPAAYSAIEISGAAKKRG
jgi:hypothetical protein